MLAFDPRTAIPGHWSLRPEDTLGMVFWTRDARNLVSAAAQLAPYKVAIHFTLTGWREVEKRSPSIELGLDIFSRTAEAFGPENMTWRFSPVPDVPDVVERFERIARGVASTGVTDVFLSFLQENDLMPEQRPKASRVALMKDLAGASHGLNVLLCNEDSSLQGELECPSNLGPGICESGARFGVAGEAPPPSEGCGCALAVDPFTRNESCHLGCEYCYAADRTSAPKKRNTTKHLPVMK